MGRKPTSVCAIRLESVRMAGVNAGLALSFSWRSVAKFSATVVRKGTCWAPFGPTACLI